MIMARCTSCGWYYHPDFCLMVDDDVFKCVWCYSGKKEITIKDETTGEEKKFTKEQATRQYLEYLRRLKDQPEIQRIIDGE